MRKISKETKTKYVDLLLAGTPIVKASKLCGIEYHHILAEMDKDLEFRKNIRYALRLKDEQILEIEKQLFELGTKGGIEITRTYKPIWKDGEIMRDAKGKPILELVGKSFRNLPPDTKAMAMALKAYKPELYGDKVEVNMKKETTPEEDLQELKRLLKEKGI